MPREDSEKICCVCLGFDLKLNNLSMKDENELTLHSKLTICVSEIEWLELYRICEQCMKLLDISYTFRETCLKSELEQQKGLGIKLENQDLIEDKTNKEEFNEVEDKVDLIDESDLIKLEVKKEVDEVDLTEQPRIDTTGDVKDETTYNDSCGIEGHYLDQVDLEDKSEDIEYEPQKRKKRNIIFTCDKCGNTYKSSIKLVDHCIKDHGMKKIDVRPFICDRCPTRFRKSSNLIQHIKYHEGDRSNICTYCGKGFITKSGLNIHVKQHLNKREFRCDECGKCFNTHKDIRSHKLIVHTDSTSWKYCCEICNKPFPIKSNYDNHMRTHSEDKQFECDLCQRKFSTKCVLQRHMRTHSDVRDHKCSNCKREYKDPRILKIHMAKHHGIGVEQIKIPPKEKKYSCNLCSKSYYAKNKLTRHLYTHSGEKPYDCPVCGKKFIDKSYIKHHLKKLHNMDEAPQENNETVNTDSVPV